MGAGDQLGDGGEGAIAPAPIGEAAWHGGDLVRLTIPLPDQPRSYDGHLASAAGELFPGPGGADLIAAGLGQQGIHPGAGGLAEAAVSQLLEAVGEAADEELPVVTGRVGADERAPPISKVAHRQLV